MDTRVTIEHPLGVRAGWGIAAAGSALVAAACVALVVTAARPFGFAASLVAMALAYAWAAAGAARLARGGASVAVGDSDVVIEHRGLFDAPLVVPRASVAGVVVDPRPAAARRVAAAVRRGIVPSDFVDPALPAVSARPSAHWEPGGRATPNVVVLLREPVSSPRIPFAVRALLRVAAGRSGRYRGPKPRSAMSGFRLVADDPTSLARHLGVVQRPRNDRYLAPVTGRDRDRVRRERTVAAAVLGAVVVILVATARFGR